MATTGHIVITGQMGVGKSTAAAGVAQRLGWPHRDSDSDIEELTGRTGREIAATDGVEALHRLEAEVLLEALDHESALVISAAASTIDHPECRRRLAAAFVVVLTAGIDTLIARATAGDHRRDIPQGRLEALIATRGPQFAEAADVMVSAEQPPSAVVAAILRARAEATADPGAR
jgi:shikimate kinase